MSDFNNLLEQRRYFHLGIDMIRRDKTMHDILHGDVETGDEDEPLMAFEDLPIEHSAALLLGCACALEDVLREIPKRTVTKAKKAAFHTDDVGADDDE